MTDSSSYTKKGVQLYFEDKFLEAIKNFNKAIELDPAKYDSWDFRGRSKYFQGSGSFLHYSILVNQLDFFGKLFSM